MDIFVTKLKYLRLKNGLTLTAMSRKIGIEIGAYSMIESRKRIGSIDTFFKIQEAFDLSDAETWEIVRDQFKGE